MLEHFGLFDGDVGIVVSACRDDDGEVQVWHDEQSLTDIAECRCPGHLLALPCYAAGPPKISVPKSAAGGEVGRIDWATHSAGTI